MKRRELVIERTFDAPRRLVWRAWTEPERIKAWWGPKGFTSPYARMDVRVGGRYLYCMRAPDGKDYWSTGAIKEVEEPSHLVLTDSFADKDGNVVPATYYGMSGDWPLELEVIITLEESEDKTKQTIRYPDLGTAPDKDVNDMKVGWEESFDKLAEHLKTAHQ